MDIDKVKEQITNILYEIGEDPEREGLQKTPLRVAKAYEFLTQGYSMKPADVINDALFTVEHSEMVLVKDIDFYSLCEHHMLPFFGKCHVAYLPDKKVVGLSKLPRLVEIFARRLQVQERMNNQIAYTVQELIQPLGVGVVIEAQHLCMQMRGVQKQNSLTITSSMIGMFKENPKTRAEFMHLVNSRR